MMRRLAAGVGLVSVVLGGWLLGAEPAGAHAAISSTSPADGEVLEVPPTAVRLSFTEPPDLALTSIDLVDASGASRPLGAVERAPGGTRGIVAVVQGDLPEGVYTVTWSTVSRTDGHPTAGAFTFGVGVTAEQVPPPPPGGSTRTVTPSVASVAGRWLLYVGLAVLFGAAAAGLLALGPMATTRGWLIGSAWALAAAGIVTIVLAERSAIGVPLGTLLSSDTGGAFVRLGVAVGVAGVAALIAVLRPGRATLIVLGAAVGAAMLARAAGSHAGGSTTSVVAQAIHLAGVGAWIGGLVWLLAELRRGPAPSAIRRFSNLAAGGLLVVFASGVVRAADELGGLGWWLHPFANDYRTTLSVKLALVVPLVALGAANRFRNVRRFERADARPLLRTVGGEILVAATVFAAAGVVTGLPPQGVEAAPRQTATPTPTPTMEPLAVAGADFATTTRVQLEIAPGAVGANEFTVEVTDFDTGEPVDARRVSLAFVLPDRPEVGSSIALERQPNGTWTGNGTALAMLGAWDVTVLVEGSGSSVEIHLPVAPRSPGQQVDVTESPGLPTIYTITVAGGFQLQAYVDPGEPGRVSNVHLTAFDPDGAELPLGSATIDAIAPHGHAVPLVLQRLGPGHFSGVLDVEEGTWTFALSATARDGTALGGTFEQSFD
jgi:copper transport protein